MNRFGRIAVVANPTAKNGAAREAARTVAVELRRAFGTDEGFDLMLTEGPGHAAEIAAGLHGAYRTVVAVGGDGLVHEIANGLMRRDEADRPTLGVVPVGSGNDYAETLGMSYKVEKAVSEILDFNAAPADVGRVNGEYFVETLSFGLDAAIALDTVERRRRTGRTGTLLYLESGIDQLFHHLDLMRYTAKFGDGEGALVSGEAYLFAVQLGPTYGGHFRVCPDARVDDGLFDICLAHPPLNALSATGIFLLAKGGHHTRFRQMEFRRARALNVSFEQEPAAQADGERVRGTRFSVEIEPRALRVLKGGRA